EHSGLGPHEHGILTHQHLHEHDPGWISFVVHSHDLQDRKSLARALEVIAASEYVLRVKGKCHLRDLPEPAVVQAVRSRVNIIVKDMAIIGSGRSAKQTTGDNRHEPQVQLSSGTEMYSELVFIGYHLDRESVTAKLCDYTSAHWH